MPEVQPFQAAHTSRAKQIPERLDSSISWNQTLWAYGLLAAGLFFRLWHASGTFLNSDEVMHFAAANQSSWAETYKASLTLSHPPLLIFVLHLWRGVGTSELILRMPSIIAGLAFCWLTFQWARILFGQGTAWIIYTLVLFLPTSIELSTEIRQYALLLAFAMASAYMLEHALAKNSAGSMWLSGGFLLLAIASHFSAFLFAPALGIYAVWRMAARNPGPRMVAAWIACQLAAAGLCAFFYFTQIRVLSHYFGGQDPTQAWMANSYLGHSYFVPGRVNPILFIIGRTVGVFQYTLRQLLIGDIGFVFFVAGVILLFRNKAVSTHASSRQLATLLLLPFAINCGAAMLRAYPYGGTRHSSFLLPFAVAGISVSLDRLARHKASWGIAIAAILSLVCRLSVAQKPPYFSSLDERAANMRAAIDFIRQLPHAEPIFADLQTSLMLGHYLCDQRPYVPDHSIDGFISYECGGHRVIASNTTYVFNAKTFHEKLQHLSAAYDLSPGSRIWVAQMGWNAHLSSELASAGNNVMPHAFGTEIQLFEFSISQSRMAH